MHAIRIVVLTRDVGIRDWSANLPLGGHWVVEARSTASVSQMVSWAREEDTRLVLLDDTAANGGLARAARRVRQAQREMTVVCVTSRPDPDLEVELRRMGVLYIVVRPIDLGLLEKVLQTALHTDTRKHYKLGTPPRGVPALPADLNLKR